ncbi:tetratricopeptide repeat protein [Bacillus sp. FSL K6-3431]|uniref:tetratricopeptide repeat protein n=1 Tax=Bacillus sp. FSL K6-3431 TaxID=2921500 RepID=UPI0030F663D9
MRSAELMIKYIEEQNLGKATLQFEKVKKENNDDEKFMLAQQLFDYGFLDETKELYEILLRTHPDEAELKILLAELLIEMNNEDEAFQYLEMVDRNNPLFPQALLVQADLYQMQGMYEVSEQKLLQAKNLLDKEPVIDYALAELYMSQGRFLEATRNFKSLLETGHTEFMNIDIHGRMAEALSAGGAFEQSLSYYETSLNNHLEINVLFGYALTSYQAGLYDKAIKAFKQLKEMDHEYHSLYLYLAKSYEHLEKIQEALDAIDAGIALDEFNKELHLFAANLALKQGEEVKAEKYFRDALALDPEFTAAAIDLNKLLLHQERYEDVLEIISMFELDGSMDPQFHWDAAICLQQTEQYNMALKQYELAYNECKHNRDFLVDYGYFLIEEGKRAEALKLFKQLYKLEPANDEWNEMIENLQENEN